tara:strand:+ start:146 stop:355 length:210 start_codon:yes stop_codon:yes gene_type:complete
MAYKQKPWSGNHGDKVTKISDARAACKKKGGIWNNKTNTCKIPEKVKVPEKVTTLSGKKVKLKDLPKGP